MHMIFYTRHRSPLGPLLLAATEAGMAGIYFDGHRHFAGLGSAATADWSAADHQPWLALAKIQLDEYFDGKRQAFDLALDPQGTPFQRQVWRALGAIAYGATSSYRPSASPARYAQSAPPMAAIRYRSSSPATASLAAMAI